MKLGVGNDRITIFVLFALFVAGFFAGCSNPVSDGPVTGPRVLVVQIAGESPADRTALPPAPAPVEYVISVSRGLDSLGSSTFTAGAEFYPIELKDDPAEGDVVQVEGIDGDEVKVAGGSYPLTAADIGGTPVSVTLYPLREGAGDVRLSVSFDPGSGDDEITVAELSLYQNLAAYRAGTHLSSYGARYRKDSSYGAGMNFTGSSPEIIIPIEYNDLPSGDYVVMIEFFRGTRPSNPPEVVKVSRLVQTIIVRDGLTTSIWDSSNSSVLTWNAFASSNADLAGTDGIKIDGTAITGYDPTTTSYNIYAATTTIPETTTLTVTQGEPGQTIEVALNNGAAVSLVSGLASSFAALETAGSAAPALKNTLIIKVTAPDGITEKSYIVNMSGKEIIDFYFDIDSKKYGVGSGVESGSGSINESAKTITVTVPYGKAMTSLPAPAIKHSGTSISPPDETVWGPGSSKNYTVTAVDGTTTGIYTVTVDLAKIASVTTVDGHFLSSDGFTQTGGSVSGNTIKGKITSVTGTDSLGTAITLATADYSVDDISVDNITVTAGANTAATLKVAAGKTADGTEMPTTFNVYIKNDAKAITEFYFTIDGKKYGVGAGAENDTGDISGNTITITVPYRTDLARLTPVVAVSTGASSEPASGTEKDFTGSVTYTVKPEDESSTETYTVTVDSAKIAFVTAVEGPLLWPDGFKQTAGFVSGEDIKAAITVKGTDSLGTAITLATADYSVGDIIGAAPKDETAATLKVAGSKTAGGTELEFKFDVYIKNDAKAITEFYFAIGPKKYGVGTGTVADSGNIDEAAKTVTVIVPFGTVLTSLSPVVTVSEGASSDPDSGTEKDFTGSVTYKVTPEDKSSTETYTVTVKDFGITITVGPPGNLAVLTFSSNVPTPPEVAASTPITVEITGGVTLSPGDWYIDINGPIPVVSLTYPEADQVAFNAPAVPGFYNVNVIATVGGIDYSGSFRLTVE